MSMEIEMPVGGVIKVYGSEMVCVEDYRDKYGVPISCSACPLNKTTMCMHFNCGLTRSDFKSVHLEFYYGVKK